MFITVFQLCLVAGVLWQVYKRFFANAILRKLPGPERASFWQGNLNQFFDPNGWAFHRSLPRQFGRAAKIHGLCGDAQVYVSDPRALYHILVKDQDVFERTAMFLKTNLVCFGPGLLSIEGERHRRQRKMLNPVFSVNHMRGMVPMFHRLTKKMSETLLEHTGDGSKDVDMLSWMSRTALEYIGQGGLGYSFDSLSSAEGSANPYSSSVKGFAPVLFQLSILRQFLPQLNSIGTAKFQRWVVERLPLKRVQRLKEIVDIMDHTSTKVFEQKKKALAAGDEAVTKQVGEGKDIMSILLRANLEASEEDRLEDCELLGQMSLLIFAGQDTTSTALSRLLHVLALNPTIQERLRAEILEARSKYSRDMTYDEVMALPYLDAVIRETLRLYPPVVYVSRTTNANTVLPLSTPVVLSDGQTVDAIPLKRNTNVVIAIQAANRDPDVWGPDAEEWRPERWLSTKLIAEGASEVERLPGVYSNMLTFIGGGRACLGFKFAELETKMVLCSLLSSFKFEPAVEIFWKLGGIISPTVAGQKNGKPSLPLRVTRLTVSESE